MTHERGSSPTAFDDWNGPTTVVGEAERLLYYWEVHGDDPMVVERWAIHDMLGFVRFILAEASEDLED